MQRLQQYPVDGASRAESRDLRAGSLCPGAVRAACDEAELAEWRIFQRLGPGLIGEYQIWARSTFTTLHCFHRGKHSPPSPAREKHTSRVRDDANNKFDDVKTHYVLIQINFMFFFQLSLDICENLTL